jgi:hypothetical protein
MYPPFANPFSDFSSFSSLLKDLNTEPQYCGSKMGIEKEEKLCPKCGSPYSYIEERKVGNNIYYYAVHYSKTRGKRRKRYCYLVLKAMLTLLELTKT